MGIKYHFFITVNVSKSLTFIFKKPINLVISQTIPLCMPHYACPKTYCNGPLHNKDSICFTSKQILLFGLGSHSGNWTLGGILGVKVGQYGHYYLFGPSEHESASTVDCLP